MELVWALGTAELPERARVKERVKASVRQSAQEPPLAPKTRHHRTPPKHWQTRRTVPQHRLVVQTSMQLNRRLDPAKQALNSR
jgi:hypothetical protein